MEEPVAKLELVDLRLRYAANGKAAPQEGPAAEFAVDLRGTSAPSLPIRILPGEFTILLGPSGCGKSSLLRMIAGLQRPTDGVILKDGKPVTGPGRDRGMVFQSYTTFPWLTVEENVSFPLRLQAESKPPVGELRDRVAAIIELVSLTDARRKYPRELSGGMKQRVAIARALVSAPDVLLMDEPFGALDPHIRLKMQELVLEIERKLKTTVVFVTHDAREAVFLGDVIFISTLRPCFLKYRIEHPFPKSEHARLEVRQRFANDFLKFQREVEDKMQYLIEHPEEPHVHEEQVSFRRSIVGMFQEISSAGAAD